MSQVATNTRDRILHRIRRDDVTISELVDELQITPAAVRTHMNKLEQDGLVAQSSRRYGKSGQPAIVYSFRADKEDAFSLAYKPLLVQILELLPDKINEEELISLFEETGKQLAKKEPAISELLQDKVDHARNILTTLGALVELDDIDNGIKLTSYSCPLADAVRCRPEICTAVTGFLREVTSTTVIENCHRDKKPLVCEFLIMNSLE